jgi:6-phosphogluconate dehydrogenase
MKKEVLIVGLGKMGSGIALNLLDQGYRVFGYNRTHLVTKKLERQGIHGVYDFSEVRNKISKPRIVWIMVPSGEAIEGILLGDNAIIKFLEPGDYVIDAGNSYFKNTINRYKIINKKGIKFIDVGVSGGPQGARYGASLMIGGHKENFEDLKFLFKDLSVEGGYEFFEGQGAGHFVKMVHNAIEYGMMQSIAEGFNLLKKSNYNFDLEKVANVYSKGSVIESKLIKLLHEGFKKYTQDLEEVTSRVAYSGEVGWTIKTAEELQAYVEVIKKSLEFRKKSHLKETYIGKILSMLRNMFGGHSI